MAANYVLLAKNVVGAAGTASVTFSNIPQTGYTDLVIRFSTRDTDAGTASHFGIIFNGDTGANYSSLFVRGDGSGSILSFSQTHAYIVASYQSSAGSTANSFGTGEMYIPNYTGSTQKSVSLESISETNNALAYMNMTAAKWTGTSAITSITLKQTIGGTFVPYSTFYLYGVAKLGTTPAIVPYATGGDTIMTDGTYWYHAFKASGTFTPAKAITCDYLVIAGGGGGTGSYINNGYAGAGAGGLRSTVGTTGGGGSLESAVSLNSGTAYTVTIGAGGSAGGSGGSAGNNSSISGTGLTTITSVGGGPRNTTGGSGGGGSYDPNTYGLGTAGQGYRGGNGYIVGGGDTLGGGGGGAGAVGANATSTVAGGGGIGVQITAFATPTETGVSSGYYAGGGGAAAEASGRTAGTGGTGGGGNGAVASGNATSGVANTGGGGGAAGSGTRGAGGSGLVIVRYAI